MSTFIDLSLPIQATPSEATPVTITVLDHNEAPHVFGLEPHDFPNGMAISNEQVALTSHTGTHMDAPMHYGPFSGGQPARSITEVPLAWCYGRGVRLDVRHREPGEEIRREDIMQAEAQLDIRVAPLDIVLVWTGADRFWGSAKYLTEYPGLGRGAVAYLVERGVRVIGIDAWGMDRPMEVMLRDYRATGDKSYLWPAHLYGREQEYCQLEKLANLHLLPLSYGFQVVCFPVALANAGASWARVVAIVE
jgi:kynurenine formamidase